MIPWGLILKVLALIGMAAAVVGGVWYGVHAIHEDGRKVERADWLGKENKELADKQLLLDAAAADNLALIEQNVKLNDEVATHAAKETQKIYDTDAAMRRDPDGLRIPAETCRAVELPAAADSAAVDNGSGRFSWVRLPGRTENDLYDYALKANRTRVKRDECREWALGVQEVGRMETRASQ
ncbi:hypothetical protein SAMN05216428_10162 [Nitrosospira sp. Nsp11]|uniref:hypothetical protein n=1 Tax=Nitrosospira sp. Nsp11 TaxID=1855338 RepID=UPI000910EC8E|nr:hypothetical protein [Nitrosospira sp. Nsp11]SHL09712.1 hypothetical protein SAMN05216428_10162 [Nitrosospira sp. Nsp11]